MVLQFNLLLKFKDRLGIVSITLHLKSAQHPGRLDLLLLLLEVGSHRLGVGIDVHLLLEARCDLQAELLIDPLRRGPYDGQVNVIRKLLGVSCLL